ncbi:MAG: hypothetical protein ACEQSB_04095 [Undibacterium sp.]
MKQLIRFFSAALALTVLAGNSFAQTAEAPRQVTVLGITDSAGNKLGDTGLAFTDLAKEGSKKNLTQAEIAEIAAGTPDSKLRPFGITLSGLKAYDDAGKPVEFNWTGAKAYIMALGKLFGNTGPSVHRVKLDHASAVSNVTGDKVTWDVNTAGNDCRGWNYVAVSADGKQRAWIGHPGFGASNATSSPFTVLAATDKKPGGDSRYPALFTCFDYAKGKVVPARDKAWASRQVQPPAIVGEAAQQDKDL